MHAPPAHPHRLHLNPGYVAVVILAAAVVGLAAWLVVDNVTGGNSATQDATAVIDDFNTAVTAQDGTTAMTMMTPEVIAWVDGSVVGGANMWASKISSTPTLTVERIAPVSVEGDYATTFAGFSVPAQGQEPTTFLMVYQLRDGKIARLWQFLPGQSVPLDNALR
jgi:ketosteroid isomerase-like protein